MRCEVCWMICVLFRVSVSVLRSPSSSPEPFYIPVHRTISPELFRPVHQIRLAAPFTSTVLRPCFQLCSPFPSPLPSSILVPVTVLHSRLRNRPPSRLRYRPSSSSPKPSSVHVFSSVLRPRHLNHPPSSSPEPSSIPVFSRLVFCGCN